MQEYYKKQEIKDHLDDYLNENLDYLKENYPTSWKDDLHHYAFNEDYFIIGTYQAKQWLGNHCLETLNAFVKRQLNPEQMKLFVLSEI